MGGEGIQITPSRLVVEVKHAPKMTSWRDAAKHPLTILFERLFTFLRDGGDFWHHNIPTNLMTRCRVDAGTDFYRSRMPPEAIVPCPTLTRVGRGGLNRFWVGPKQVWVGSNQRGGDNLLFDSVCYGARFAKRHERERVSSRVRRGAQLT